MHDANIGHPEDYCAECERTDAEIERLRKHQQADCEGTLTCPGCGDCDPDFTRESVPVIHGQAELDVVIEPWRQRAEAAERRWKYVLADFKTMTKAYGEEQDANRKLREATKRERERCAEIADSYCCKAECGGTQDADHHSQCWTADAIAAAIRGGE